MQDIASYDEDVSDSAINDAIIDSLVRYKKYIEESNDGVKVVITTECEDDSYHSLNRFVIDIVLGDMKILRVEFNDVKCSSIYQNFLKGYIDMSDSMYLWFTGLAVWAGCFNRCVKTFGLSTKYKASYRIYG